MEALPLCNPQPLAIQHNEFSKHLPPSLSAWQPWSRGTVLVCPSTHSRSCRGSFCPGTVASDAGYHLWLRIWECCNVCD